MPEPFLGALQGNGQTQLKDGGTNQTGAETKGAAFRARRSSETRE
jgi:hypothetical protein